VESAGISLLAATPGRSGYSKLSESAMIFWPAGETRKSVKVAAAA
jgi:hypothetical protein